MGINWAGHQAEVCHMTTFLAVLLAISIRIDCLMYLCIRHMARITRDWKVRRGEAGDGRGRWEGRVLFI